MTADVYLLSSMMQGRAAGYSGAAAEGKATLA